MIRIEAAPWRDMLAHAQATYPDECCGVMIGVTDDGEKTVRAAVPLDNAFDGERRERYLLRNEDLLRADREASARQMEVIGIYHSHPDCGAYFSKTDLENSCPWYSFVVLSVQNGRFDHAASFLPNMELTAAPEEELICPKS
jgi:proteasome lid subunit RPN8/RPN11